MSTRRDRAARAVAVGIWPHIDVTEPEMVEAYRIGDMVLTEVDRIPDVSELDAWTPLTGGGVGSEPSEVDSGTTPPSPVLGRSACKCRCITHGTAQPCGCVCWRDHKTDDGAVRTGEEDHSLAAGARSPGPVVTPLDLARRPRVFELYRHRDVTGKSGTGVVAWGAVWPDGTVSLRWAGETQSFSNWESLDVLVAVHGHEGATEVRWLDGGE